MRLIAKCLLLIVSFAVCGALSEHARGGGGPFGSMIVVAFLAFVATIAHELGHACAVLAVKGRVHAFMALPLELRFRPTRLAFVSRAGRGDLGGYVLYTLGTRDSYGRRLMIAGAGPLANLVLAVLVGLSSNALPVGSGQDTLIALSLLSGGMGLANLIPFEGSDGARILKASRQKLRTVLWRN